MNTGLLSLVRSTLRLGATAGVLIMSAACTESPSAPTQVVVLVGGDINVRSLDVRIYDVEGKQASGNLLIDLERRDPNRLPTSFTVIPPETDAADRFRMIVQGFAQGADGGERKLARREVIVAFSRGETTLLPLVLSALCAEEPCGCVDEEPCSQTCSPELSTADDDVCTPLPIYESLPSVVPGGEIEALRSSLGGCPRGTIPGANGDCEDLDECAFFIDECQVEPRACVNLPPEPERYTCRCPPGLSGTGFADDHCKRESAP